jgi:Leucine-rich repeat (LRR) protein
MPLQELTREFAEAVARQHPALQTLSLARNALSHVRFLELLPPLRRLDLSANALRALPAETAEWGPSLEFLDLSDNALCVNLLYACVCVCVVDSDVVGAAGNRSSSYASAARS